MIKKIHSKITEPTRYHSSSSVVLTKKIPSVAKKHHESTIPESLKLPKSVFFFLQTGQFNIAWLLRDAFHRGVYDSIALTRHLKPLTQQLWLYTSSFEQRTQV